MRYSATHFAGSVPVDDKQNNWTYAEVVPTDLRVNPTYSKVTADNNLSRTLIGAEQDIWHYNYFFTFHLLGSKKGCIPKNSFLGCLEVP